MDASLHEFGVDAMSNASPYLGDAQFFAAYGGSFHRDLPPARAASHSYGQSLPRFPPLSEASTSPAHPARAPRDFTPRLEAGAEAVPGITVEGTVTGIADLAEDVVEVTVAPRGGLGIRPGQYLDVAFDGFPARAFCPTARLDGQPEEGLLRFHVERARNGRVSTALGREIFPGHRVTVSGPRGSAWLRPARREPLVLVSGGVGFAQVWAVACAALIEDCERQITVIAGARSVRSLYMAGAMELLMLCRNVTAVMVTAEPQDITPLIGTGNPAQFLPALGPGVIVHAAGSPELVTAVVDAAQMAAAVVHADAFISVEPDRMDGLMRRLQQRAAALAAGEPSREKSGLSALSRGRGGRM
jgi:3-phenylpropionate/trans-cinnamate dioxygenase ferredoxin reductase subunit